MGSASFTLDNLSSREITRKLTNNAPRLLKVSNSTRTESGGVIEWLMGAGQRLLGFLGGVFGRIFSFSWSAAWSAFVSTAMFIWNFNWNATDEQLDQQVQSAWNSLAGQLGGTLGNAVGYLLCGIAPGAAIFSFNEPLGLYVLKRVGEEALEELAGNVEALIRSTINASVRTGFTYLYKNARTIIKAHATNPIVKRIFGDKIEKAAQGWGAKGAKPWSFAKALEDTVESIPNEALRNFVEEFLEEAWEGCVEAGYIVANSLDTFAAQQKAAPVVGTMKVVEVKPNRKNDEERYILAGGSELVKPALVNLLTNHQLIQNYDVGTFIGDEPMLNYLRAKKVPLTLKIELASVVSPPWNRSKQKALYTIPDVSRSKLDYESIRGLCGGTNGMVYGAVRASYDLDNGRPIWAFGSTEQEAEEMINRMLAFTNAKPVTATPKFSKRPKVRDPITGQLNNNEPIRVYPKKITIINQEKQLIDAGRLEQTGKYIRKNISLWIYSDTKPLDFDVKMQDLLQRSS